MSLRPRFMLSSLTLAAALGGSSWTAQPARAGCLCDWLFGRTAAVPAVVPAAPYAAGYAPYVAGYAPYTAAYAPASPYVAGYAPTATVPTAGYAPYASSAMPYTSAYPAAALQQPSYGAATVGVYDNPSVYTGRPVVMAPGSTTNLPLTTALRPSLNTQPFSQFQQNVPLSSNIRGNETAASPFYGTGNVYPDSSAAAATYQAAYAAAYPNTTGPVGGTATTIPTTQIAPPFTVAPAPSHHGGLSRFFGSLFGTRYSSSYYRAPITYYRPVNTIDPATGSTVTVQQPCSSYVEQLQRTPYSSMLAQPAAPLAPPATVVPNYQSPTCDPNLYGANGYQPNGYSSTAPLAGPSGVAPVGGYVESPNAYASPSDRSVVPIPSITPPSYAPADSYAPSNGYAPSAGFAPAPLTGSTSVGGSNGDQAPVTQPELQSGRPSIEFSPSDRGDDRNRYQQQPDESSYRSSGEEPSTPSEPMWRRESTFDNKSTWDASPRQDSTASRSMSTPSPIPAPQDYQARESLGGSFSTRSETSSRPSTSPVTSSPSRWDALEARPVERTLRLEAPPLPAETRATSNLPPLPPASFTPPSMSTSESLIRSSTPAREASLPTERRRATLSPAPIQQPAGETGWYPIQ